MWCDDIFIINQNYRHVVISEIHNCMGRVSSIINTNPSPARTACIRFLTYSVVRELIKKNHTTRCLFFINKYLGRHLKLGIEL